MFKRFCTTLTALFILAACSSNTTPVITVEAAKPIHPARPLPVDMKQIKWSALVPDTKDKLTVGDDYRYMCLRWEEYLTLGQNMQSILRYVKESNVLLCYYRKDLNEVQCTPIVEKLNTAK